MIDRLKRKLVYCAIAIALAGVGWLAVRTILPGASPSALPVATGQEEAGAGSHPYLQTQDVVAPTAPFTISIALADEKHLPSDLVASLRQLATHQPKLHLAFTTTQTLKPTDSWLDWQAEDGTALYQQTFAAATRFDTIDLALDFAALQAMWQGETLTYTAIVVLSDTLPALTQRLGSPAPNVQARATISEVVDAVWADRSTLTVLPFEQLVPRLAVFSLEGQNPVENVRYFDPQRYPLQATVYLHPSQATEPMLPWLAAHIPAGNRNPAKLTVLAVTGVTALVRTMAAQMEERGNDWPARVVSETLANADLTLFSNEVSFSPACTPAFYIESTTFCSRPAYFEAMRLTGVDLVSLTGNHLNDYGTDFFQWTLDFYAKQGLPAYGGGTDSKHANQPLILQHNGNQLIFLGSNTVGPQSAWATDTTPGAARYDADAFLILLRKLRTTHPNAVILTDLQFLESYNLEPLYEQRKTFNLLVQFGADIVTGMQSHVPQAMEFTDGKLILYGLGNFYFDQMSFDATRQGLVLKHTFYAGHHLSTQVLPTVIYDSGQPHWATPEQREAILSEIFAASYW